MMKKILSLLLVFAMLFSISVTAFASEIPQDPNEIYASSVPELKGISFEQIESFSENELDYYFEKAFPLDANDYTYEEKLSVVKAISVAESYQSIARATSTTSNLSSYTGNEGVAWVRDTTSGHSPLTFAEALSGTYTLEVDYLTYKMAVTIYAAGSDYNFFTSLKNAGTTSVASALICAKMGLSDLVIPSVIVSIVVGMGWDALSALDRSAMKDVLDQMSYSSMMKVTFMTANNFVTKCYSIYSPSTTYNSAADNFTYRNIANPYSGKYGFWYTNQTGYLYSY